MASQQHRLVLAVQTHAKPYGRGASIYIGRPGVKLRNASGQITEAGRRYEAMVAERGDRRRYEHADYFHADARVEYRDGDQYVEDTSGNMQRTRRWDPTLNGGQGGHRFTPVGRRFGHSSTRYIVDVPVTMHEVKVVNGQVVHRAVRTRRSGEPWYIPVNSDSIGDIAAPDLRVVRHAAD